MLIILERLKSAELAGLGPFNRYSVSHTYGVNPRKLSIPVKIHTIVITSIVIVYHLKLNETVGLLDGKNQNGTAYAANKLISTKPVSV